jgi:hypothetical protein
MVYRFCQEADDESAENGFDGGKTVCNHLIAMQTVLTAKDGGFRNMEWSALDFSGDPPAYRHFTAEFEDDELVSSLFLFICFQSFSHHWNGFISFFTLQIAIL